MYQKQEKILLSDLNAFITRTAAIYGVGTGDRGYGLGRISTSVATGGIITSEPWKRLRGMIAACAEHQGLLTEQFVPADQLAGGKVIKAYETSPPTSNQYDLGDYITAIEDHRLDAAMANMSLVTEHHTITRATDWSSEIETTVTLTFTNENAARYFFNTGGNIRFRLSQPGSTDHALSWNNILGGKVAVVSFGANRTTNTGSVTATRQIGYYGLAENYQVIYNGLSLGDGMYTLSDVLISAKYADFIGLNGAKGSSVQFKIKLTDGYENSLNDVVPSGTRLIIDVYKANLQSASVPVVTVNTAF